MKSLLCRLALMLIALFAILPVAGASMVVEVTADSLNVRESPSLESNIIGALNRGEIVVASEPLQNGWLMVSFDNRFGYIYGKFVRIIRTDTSIKSQSFKGSRYSEKKCDAYSSKLLLTLDKTDLKCHEGLFSNGYENCDIAFNISIRSDCTEYMKAYVTCDVDLQYETKDGIIPRRDSESVDDFLYVRNGKGFETITLHWRPRTLMDPVIKVKLRNTSCSIIKVYDY